MVVEVDEAHGALCLVAVVVVRADVNSLDHLIVQILAPAVKFILLRAVSRLDVVGSQFSAGNIAVQFGLALLSRTLVEHLDVLVEGELGLRMGYRVGHLDLELK